MQHCSWVHSRNRFMGMADPIARRAAVEAIQTQQHYIGLTQTFTAIANRRHRHKALQYIQQQEE